MLAAHAGGAARAWPVAGLWHGRWIGAYARAGRCDCAGDFRHTDFSPHLDASPADAYQHAVIPLTPTFTPGPSPTPTRFPVRGRALVVDVQDAYTLEVLMDGQPVEPDILGPARGGGTASLERSIGRRRLWNGWPRRSPAK